MDEALSHSGSPSIAILLGGPGVEGGIDGSNEPTSTWQQAERLGRVEPTGFGLGFFEDPAPLIEHVGQSGVDEVFVRLSWARLVPREGFMDLSALDRYVEIVRHLAAKGLLVSIILSDGTMPGWMGVEGWLLPAAPERFVEYATAVVEAIGHDISTVVTFEEPGQSALSGWVFASAPPFRILGVADAMAVVDAMMAAHGDVVRGVLEMNAGLSVTYMTSSTSVDLEGLVLGAMPNSLITNQLTRWIPGRARSGADQILSKPFVSVGRGPTPRQPAGLLLSRIIGRTSEILSPESVGDSLIRANQEHPDDATSVVLRHVAAIVDAKGRRTQIHGHRRIDELQAVREGASRAEQQGVSVERIVVGELVDRWSFGSYCWREGFLGVDRTRGPRGVTLLSSDAAGVDALSDLQAFCRIGR